MKPLRVTAEVLPTHREQDVELKDRSTGLDLLRALDLTPEAHVLVRHSVPIPADEPLLDGDRIRVVHVISGGALP